ncbi:hypothetical protein O71_10904 [Pontibacter sp. BAB1700]|nr:hypothetical protein O71_10904 [Pontibacter sp. BAB1700]
MLEADVVVHGEFLKAALWVNFDQAFMNANFTLEKDGTVIFSKFIDKARLGSEFFLEMYKKIEVKNDTIIIKGHRDVEYLPLKILIDTNT